MYDILSNRREWKAADDTGPAPLQLDASEERTESSARKGMEVRLVSHEPMESR